MRQLDRALETIIGRAWAAGAGPGRQPLTIDLGSTVAEVAEHGKQGASFGYTKRRGYHPLLATRADTGEVLHARMRKGLSFEPARRRAIRARAGGACPARGCRGHADRARRLRLLEQRHDCRARAPRRNYSIGVTQQAHVREAIGAIPEEDWQPLADYPPQGVAEIAQGRLRGRRLIVSRTRLVGVQTELFPDWRHHPFVTDRHEPLAEVELDHRRHAQIELAIRDLKQGSGLNHAPSGHFFANAAWLLVSCLAHNLLRWLARLGLELHGPIVAQTIRRRYLTLPRSHHPQRASPHTAPARPPAGRGASASGTRSRSCGRSRC